MWMSRSAARDKSGYVFNSINAARAMVNDE
jgi:threonine dehydrogenase-like Zn-dependent dehydrogenase